MNKGFTLAPWGLVLLPTLLPVLSANAQLSLTSSSPVRHALSAPWDSNVILTFSAPIDASTASELRVFSTQSGGRKAAQTTTNGATVTIDPDRNFKPGEIISVTVPATVSSQAGTGARRTVYQFTTATRAAPATFTTGPTVGMTTPKIAALGDIDNDGDLDLLMASNGSSTVAIRLNNGRGIFSPGPDVLMSGAISHISTADLDSDGDLDLFTLTPLGVTVRYNDGSGTFVGGADYSFGGGGSNAVSDVAVGDVDGDGDLDFIGSTVNPYGGYMSPFGAATTQVSVLRNNGAGVFGVVSTPSVGGNPYGVQLADVDNDGDLDLLATSTQSNAPTPLVSMSIRRNTSGIFSGSQQIPMPGLEKVFAVADINGDGDVDILALTAAGVVNLYSNDGSGAFSNTGSVSVGQYANSLAVGDVDGDGDLDLMTANFSATTNAGNSLAIRLNNGSGAFTAGTSPVAGGAPTSLVTGDVDNDGDLDAVTCNGPIGTVSVRLNGGTGVQLASTPARPLAGALAPNPASGTAWLRLFTPLAAFETLQLTDALGRTVRRFAVGAGTTEVPVNLNGVPAGLYLVRCGTFTGRLVVE